MPTPDCSTMDRCFSVKFSTSFSCLEDAIELLFFCGRGGICSSNSFSFPSCFSEGKKKETRKNQNIHIHVMK